MPLKDYSRRFPSSPAVVSPSAWVGSAEESILRSHMARTEARACPSPCALLWCLNDIPSHPAGFQCAVNGAALPFNDSTTCTAIHQPPSWSIGSLIAFSPLVQEQHTLSTGSLPWPVNAVQFSNAVHRAYNPMQLPIDPLVVDWALKDASGAAPEDTAEEDKKPRTGDRPVSARGARRETRANTNT